MSAITIGAALHQTTLTLNAAGIADPGRDARILVAHAAGIAAGRLRLHVGDDFVAAKALSDMVDQRLANKPVAMIIGGREFWGRWFKVTQDTLVPRPDTETLIDAALEEPFDRVLDLGTGSGVIAVTLLAERPGATGLATDMSEGALVVAAQNAKAAGLDGRLKFQRADWFAGLSGQFDLIVSNPPYIGRAELAALGPDVRDWDPVDALSPGDDALGAYRQICANAIRHLLPGGRLMVEIGLSQGAQVSELFLRAGLSEVSVIPDLDGRDRVVRGVFSAK